MNIFSTFGFNQLFIYKKSMGTGNFNQDDFSLILEKLSNLENRLSVLEENMGLIKNDDPTVYLNKSDNLDEFNNSPVEKQEEKSLESHIGEYGLAWLGNIVFLFSGIFLHLFIQGKGFPLISAVVGFLLIGFMLILSAKMEKSFSYLSGLFKVFAQLFLFYVVASFHFFFKDTLVDNVYAGMAILLLVVIYQIYQSWKYQSEKFTILGLIFLISTAILSNQSTIILPLLLAASALSVFLFHRFAWTRSVLLTIMMVYFSYLLWLLGNPFINSAVQVLKESQWSEYYLLGSAALFSLIFLFKRKGSYSNSSIFSILIFNGIGFSFIIGLMLLMFFKENYQMQFAYISLFCVLYSVVLKKYSPWKYSPALYAVYGFITISITFYGVFQLPMIFLTLTLQSLLVLSMALWFRSKIIVVMNTFMFVTLTISYFPFFESIDIISFSFPIVAGISARIINWQQDRLTLKTQYIRNIYLFILLFTLLYSLKNALPSEYITLSWALSAVIFFGLSILLQLVKYRYLAISALLAASIYLIFVDLATINLIYRIIAFLLLAIISIGISVYYVELSRKKKEAPND